MESPSAPEPVVPLTIDALPDALLGRIFSVADRPTKCAAASVSRRWHRALFGSREVWSIAELRISPARDASPEQLGAMLASKRRLLERQAPLVVALVVRGRVDACGRKAVPPSSLADFLSCLSPGSLTELLLIEQDLSPGALHELQRYPKLENLAILQWQGDLPAEFGPAMLAEVAALASLRRLRITAGTLPPLQPLTVLARLEQLTVRESWSRLMAKWGMGYAPVELLSVNPFPEAMHWKLAAHVIQVTPDITLSGMDRGPAELILSGQPSLRTCPELLLVLEACHSGLLGAGSLQAVLRAVLPPAVPLRQLSISACAVAEQTFEGCTQLAAVTLLELTDVYAVALDFGGLEVNPVYSVGRMLAQMPALQLLRFHRCDMLAGLPSTVTGLTQLKELRAWHCNVHDLPAGPYLSGLTQLNLCAHPNSADPTLERLPPALESATELRMLDLSYHRDLRLDAAAADLLAALPHLRELKLLRVKLPQAFTRRLAERRPDVQLVTA